MKPFFLALFLSLLLCAPTAKATHIVGGGFQMKAIGNYQYIIQLTLYFDDVNGSAGALDQEVFFSIYRKSDNVRMQTLTSVPLDADVEVINYTGAACGTSGGAVRTKVLKYEQLTTLSPNTYNDEAGYYVMWERCCRNNVISNIQVPGEVGQTFLLEFPPVQKNGQPFENDSPVFKPVPNSLFCINQPSQIDFSATDFDGDSLVFDLVDPIISKDATTGNPTSDVGSPAPYPSVTWQPGYSTAKQITGNPGLTIDRKTGRLSLVPNTIGLFVFAVRCSEYRAGKKIGEVRREFQQVVISCPPNTAPTITIPNPTGGVLKPVDTLRIENLTQNRTCISVKAKDLQVGQTITLRAIPLNFTPLSPISGDTIKVIQVTGDTARLSFCLPACVGSSPFQPFHMRIVVADNGCAGSLTDTSELFIILKVPPTNPPQLIIEPGDTLFQIPAGDSLKVRVRTIVPFNQINSLKADVYNNRAQLLSLGSIGVSFPSGSGLGPIERLFRWKAPCTSPANMPYQVVISAATNFCNQPITLQKPFFFKTLPPVADARIQIKGFDSTARSLDLESPAGASTTYDVLGKSKPGTNVSLLSVPAADSLSKYGIRFQAASGLGTVQKPLTWAPDCETAKLASPFKVLLIARQVKCNQNADDTLRLAFKPEANLETSFEPINLLIRNGDQLNETFSLESLGLKLACDGKFDEFVLFDRWGKEAFRTSDPAFVWPPKGEDPGYGTWFYLVRIDGITRTSWLQVVGE